MNKLVFFVWIALALSLFFASLENQVIFEQDSTLKKNIFTLLPQGWGFFTKDPRNKQLDVYEVNGRKMNKVITKNFSIETFFGLSRKARYIGYESAQVINNIDNKHWTSDTFGNLNKLKSDKIYEYSSNDLKYLKKGSYIFISYKIVPYKWAKNNQENNKPIEYIFVEIK